MGENHKCNMCGKPATVHLTQITGDKVQKMDLCEACAHKKGVMQTEGFPLSDALSNLANAVGGADGAGTACPHCGMTAQDYKRLGRLGCADCYEGLKTVVDPMIEQMQHQPHHGGKAPARDVELEKQHQTRLELRVLLDEAIRQERYEDAAKLRDELASLEPASGKPSA